MNIKQVLEADKVPLVDIDFMNNTHLEELSIANELAEHVAQYQDGKDTSKENSSKISKLLDKWLAHTIPHFERENKLMEKIGFPAYSVHADEHEIALNNFRAVINAWTENKDIDLVSDFIFTLWPDWFNRHVNSMDMMTAKFAVMNGFDPQATI